MRVKFVVGVQIANVVYICIPTATDAHKMRLSLYGVVAPAYRKRIRTKAICSNWGLEAGLGFLK